jgi:hypothetical protein
MSTTATQHKQSPAATAANEWNSERALLKQTQNALQLQY